MKCHLFFAAVLALLSVGSTTPEDLYMSNLQKSTYGSDLHTPTQTSHSAFYRDCEEAYEHGVRVSGVHTVQPNEDQPFQVYCDMDTDSGMVDGPYSNVGRTDRWNSITSGWTMPEDLGA